MKRHVGTGCLLPGASKTAQSTGVHCIPSVSPCPTLTEARSGRRRSQRQRQRPDDDAPLSAAPPRRQRLPPRAPLPAPRASAPPPPPPPAALSDRASRGRLSRGGSASPAADSAMDRLIPPLSHPASSQKLVGLVASGARSSRRISRQWGRVEPIEVLRKLFVRVREAVSRLILTARQRRRETTI